MDGEKTRKKSRPRKLKIEAAIACSNISSGDEFVEDIEDFCGDEVLKIRASLLEWYDQHKRDLPWRRIIDEEDNDDENKDRKAYAVWVSEVMLQQTRVQTVIDYYNRWMKKWPSLHHLAQASLEEVYEIWAGLGYYRRARFLLEGAKMIVEGGCGFPRTIDALRKVRGVGDYTAGAIASIAFKQAVPVVDGNVIRVISRLKAISSNPKEVLAVKNFWRLAAQLVDPSRPGEFNQALMELGATICSRWKPSCSACPVSDHCHALSASKRSRSIQVTDYPPKVVKAKQRHEHSAVCVIEILEGENLSRGSIFDNGLFLLKKRPDEGLLAGLWEFPSVLLDGEIDLTTRREAVDHFLKTSFKLEARKTCNIVSREDVGEFIHVFSHIRVRMYVELLVLNLKDGVNILTRYQDKENMNWKCVNGKVLSGIGLTSGVRKVCTMIQKFKQTKLPSSPTSAKREKTNISRN